MGARSRGTRGASPGRGQSCAPVGEWKRLGCEGRPAWPGANSQHPPSPLHPRPRGSHAGRGACGPGSSCRAPDGARDALRRDGQAAGRRRSGPELQDRPGQGLQPDGPTSFSWERLASASEMGGRCSGERVRTGRPGCSVWQWRDRRVKSAQPWRPGRGGCGLQRHAPGLWVPAPGPPRDVVRRSSGPGFPASVGGSPLTQASSWWGRAGRQAAHVVHVHVSVQDEQMGCLCQQKAPPVVSGGL